MKRSEGRRSPTEIHRRLNATTRLERARYDGLRAEVMAAIGTGERLGVFGAGNCNDLDLVELPRRFRALHLIDVDDESVVRALEAAPEARAIATVHALDVSGAYALLPVWAQRPPGREELAQLPSRASEEARRTIDVRFDVAISSLLVSQIVHTAMKVVGTSSPVLSPISIACAASHLRVALDLLAPGGRLVLVVDAFARDTAELAASIERHGGLAELLVAMDAQGLCLPGTSVSFVTHALSRMAPSARVELGRTWTWSPSSARTHLGYCMHVRT